MKGGRWYIYIYSQDVSPSDVLWRARLARRSIYMCALRVSSFLLGRLSHRSRYSSRTKDSQQRTPLVLFPFFIIFLPPLFLGQELAGPSDLYIYLYIEVGSESIYTGDWLVHVLDLYI